jgi:hypothetical protein
VIPMQSVKKPGSRGLTFGELFELVKWAKEAGTPGDAHIRVRVAGVTFNANGQYVRSITIENE